MCSCMDNVYVIVDVEVCLYYSAGGCELQCDLLHLLCRENFLGHVKTQVNVSCPASLVSTRLKLNTTSHIKAPFCSS